MRTLKALIQLIVFLGLVSCTVQKPSCKDIKIKELGYGQSNAKILVRDRLQNTPSEEHLTTDYQLNIIKKTDTIDAQTGAQFGVEYIISSKANKELLITTVWKYPYGVKNKKGEIIPETRYQVMKPANQYTYSNFTMTEQGEVVKGLWTLELYYESKLLYSRTFILK
jgi:hypothetical protein